MWLRGFFGGWGKGCSLKYSLVREGLALVAQAKPCRCLRESSPAEPRGQWP